MLGFTSILQIVSGVFMFIWSFKYTALNVFRYNGEKASTTFFNKLLAGCSIVTGIAAIALIIIDLGTLWTIIGVIHNYFEVIIIILLHQGGNLAANNNIHLYGIIYLLIAEGVTILLQWPYNAFWFKFQGLSVDWVFFIQFMRLYFATKRNYREDYISLSDNERKTEEQDLPDHHKQGYHLKHVLLLPFAAFCHIAGNVLFSIFLTDALACYLFSFSYGFTFPSLAFFVYLDTHLRPNKPKKPIFVPDPSIPNIVLVTIISITLSILCLRIGTLF
ncbi:patatin-domain-containing protein [Gigaspora margarita]|uniref:Patatin-domain-containing protein n=1 Tax=Gigaspora margarita TaxID=4874 RepID=A0A8H4A2E7_GIGMA|nr:patatin-domain-containing protein [Gigaspora margarita]